MTPKDAAIFVHKMLLVLPDVEEMSINIFNSTEGTKIWFIFKNEEDMATATNHALKLDAEVSGNPETPFTFIVTDANPDMFPNIPEIDSAYWDFIMDQEPDYPIDWPDDYEEEPFPVAAPVLEAAPHET